MLKKLIHLAIAASFAATAIATTQAPTAHAATSFSQYRSTAIGMTTATPQLKATATTTTTPTTVSPKCAIIKANQIAGYNFTRLKTTRICQNNLTRGVAGSAQLSKRIVTIRYSETNTTTRELQMATMHELVHEVEFWTTDTNRAKLYTHLGITNHPSYYGFNDANTSGLVYTVVGGNQTIDIPLTD